MTRRPTNAVLIMLAILLSPGSAISGQWNFEDVSRVVAIADIHGEYAAMVDTLQQAGILDADLGWSGARAHLVIVGDILDRGPDSRAAMDLFMRLEDEARDAGGEVQVLIGNHESMLLTGDMRYVSDAEYAAFASEEVAEERRRWLDLYSERSDQDPALLQSRFDTDYPHGYFAMRRAFRSDGKYGEWLLQKNIIAVIDGTAFVHGGLSLDVARIGLRGINEDLQQELVEYVRALEVLTEAGVLLLTDNHHDLKSVLDNFMPALDESSELMNALNIAKRLQDSALLDADGPLWYRRNATCPGIVEEFRLDAALQAIGAERIVVGHTPTPNLQVLQRFDGRLIEIDTGMLASYYGGSGNALVFEGGEISVVNQSGAVAAVPLQHPRQVGHRASGLTAPLLQDLLQHGEIISVEKVAAAKALPRTMVRISDGENTVSAVFNKRKSRGNYPGVAAYRLDSLLQLDMVPVSIIRQVHGAEGSLQFFPEKSINEVKRAAAGKGGGASCPFSDQWAAMYVFDVLIFNEGRTQGRMLYDPLSWRLMLSEHDRAFAGKKGRPGHLRSADLRVSEGWKKALAALTDEVLQQHLSDVLDERRLRALAGRRDELLSQQ